MIVLKKIVGNYARKFSERLSNFEQLSITMKTVHDTEKNRQFEINGKVMENGKPITAEIVDRNLFVAVDGVLKKIENSIN